MRTHSRGLGVRLVAAVLGTVLLAGGAVGGVAVLQARAAMRDDILSASLAAADMAAAQTASYVADTRGAVVLLADRIDVQRAMEQHDNDYLDDVLEQWSPRNPHNDGVFLFAEDGTLLADGVGKDGGGRTTVTERDWFKAVRITHQSTFGEPTASRGTGHPVVPLAAPVFDTNRTLRGIMVAPISLSSLSVMMVNVRINDNSRAVLIDLDRDLTLANADGEHLLEPSVLAAEANAHLHDDRGVLETTLQDGTPILAAVAPVPGQRWGVVVYEPTSSAFAPLEDMISHTVWLIGVALILALIGALMLALWITRPLGRLRTAAMAMADGDLERRANLHRGDEIGDLGSAFDTMADRLASTVRTLEDDVTERKRIEDELRKGQEQLRAFFDAAPIGINILDASARTIQANRALQDMIGYTEDELIGRTFSDYSHPDEQARDAMAIREMRAGGRDEVVRREKAYRHKDGRSVWVQITAATPRDADGRPLFFVSMIENMSERKRAEAALADSEHRNRAVLNAALDGILTIDGRGRITEFNPAAELMFDRTRADAYERGIGDLIVLSEGSAWSAPDALVGRRIEATAVRVDGPEMPVELAIAGYTLRDRQEYTIHVRDITARRRADLERREAEERLTRQALHDALTELPNRTLVHERLQQAIGEAQDSGESVGLLLLDLDRFKEVNDTLGHHAGDELLQQVGERLQELVRASDTVGRLGGDEFAIVLPGTMDAGSVAAKVLQALESPFLVEGHSVAVGASVGVATFPTHGEDAQALLRRADVAMYFAKRTRGGFSYYSSEQDQHSLERLALLAELREALVRDELVLHYQPKVALASREVVGVEALARWQHPRRGLLSPDQFIGLAEQSGLIRPLTSCVLHTALRQVGRWRDAGLAMPVAVNLSPHTLQEPDFADEIEALLRQHGVAPELLEVEITENAYMARPHAVIENLERLRALGVRVAIDDFGTGYSSLSYLMNLPVDELKIDRSFVRAMASNDDHAAIVRSIVELGHSLGLRVVAEGLEDEQTCARLTLLGCDLAQGYFLGRPAPAEAVFAARLRPAA